jgi:hypothetical protein
VLTLQLYLLLVQAARRNAMPVNECDGHMGDSDEEEEAPRVR